MPAMKRKESDTGKTNASKLKKRGRGPTQASAKQISPSTVTTSSEDPLATPSDSQRGSTIPRSVLSTSPDMFPHFAFGTVILQLSNEPTAQYQLHRAVLERNSTWFKRALRKDEGAPVSVVFCFTLTQPPGQIIPSLVKTVKARFPSKLGSGLTSVQNPSAGPAMTGSGVIAGPSTQPTAPTPLPQSQRVPLDRHTSTATIIDLLSFDDDQPEALSHAKPAVKAEMCNEAKVKVKQEPLGNSSASGNSAETKEQKVDAPNPPGGSSDEDFIAKQKEAYPKYVQAYHSLLAMFYNIAPQVSISDINCALCQCERVVRLATIYGSLPTVRPYLGNVLTQFRQKLYVAIAQDPPRWLLLGVALESASIYSEAMIHCAGSYPSCPWKTPWSKLPPSIFDIIKNKAEWLARLRSQVNEELLINTLRDPDGPVVSITLSPEQWIVVQIFRDWLAKQIQQHRESGTLHYGSLYRMIARGGNAYLAATDVSDVLDSMNLSGKLIDETWDDVERDLNSLKAFANKAVAQLVANKLMVDPVVLGIPYLTSVEVGEEDYPWMKRGEQIE